jgi:hypothetical protein
MNRVQGQGEILACDREADESHFVTGYRRAGLGLRHFRHTPVLHTAAEVAKIPEQQRIEIDQTRGCAIHFRRIGAPQRCYPVDYKSDWSAAIDNDNTGIRSRALLASEKAVERYHWHHGAPQISDPDEARRAERHASHGRRADHLGNVGGG